ncbi:DUF1304 domain-containing protein [Streptomyces sp. NPDC006365]|uniref:DUF1304 domain-containing protein n=1 Tax=Streptomyces sp. NPDC006365 TaxID=3364744 RepID=UPI00367CC4F1
MNAVTQLFAGLAAAIHVMVFVWETIVFDRPGVHRGIFHIPSEDLPAVKLWSFCVGFYNLFLGLGTIIGLIALHSGSETVGRTLVFYTCAYMVLAGVTLGVSDRMGLGRAKGAGIGGTVAQISPPLIALVAAAVAL